jgi:hypothetical protein
MFLDQKTLHNKVNTGNFLGERASNLTHQKSFSQHECLNFFLSFKPVWVLDPDPQHWGKQYTKQTILLNLIFILLRVQTTRGKSLQVLVSGTMEMEGVFSLAEFVTGRAVVTSGHQMVYLEPM